MRNQAPGADTVLRCVVPLSKGQVALVDQADFERVMVGPKWYYMPHKTTGYAKRNIVVNGKRTTEFLHRFLIPGAASVDHVNGNGLDCRRENLRVGSQAQNRLNSRLPSNNSSGYKGVSWNKSVGKWQATAYLSGHRVHIGYFKSAEDAARAYDSTVRLAQADWARYNFPQPGERGAR